MKINEAVNLSTVEKAIEEITLGHVHTKIPKDVKSNIVTLKSNIEKLYSRCEELKTDKTKTLLRALELSKDISSFKEISETDLAHYYVKYGQAGWFKSLKLNGDLSDIPVIEEESKKHDSKKSGKQVTDGYETLYEDDDWLVLKVTTWEAAKKVSWCYRDGKKTATNWCTRKVDTDSYFNTYTDHGKYPLYSLYYKDGRAWQTSVEPHRNSVSFLNDHDKSDEITKGGWETFFPKEALKKMINIDNGRSYYEWATTHGMDEEDGDWENKFLKVTKISFRAKQSNFSSWILGNDKKKNDYRSLQITTIFTPGVEFNFTMTDDKPEIVIDHHWSSYSIDTRKFIKLSIFQFWLEYYELDDGGENIKEWKRLYDKLKLEYQKNHQ